MPAFLATLLASVLLLFAAAKAHGRQVRLERERKGHHHVEFGGVNHPEVMALWRRDRVGFWSVVPAAFLLLAGLYWLGDQRLVPLPPVIGRDPTFGFSLVFLFLWPPILGLVAMGLASLARLLRASPTDDAAWRRDAVRGSAFWWSVVAALALAVGVCAAWP